MLKYHSKNEINDITTSSNRRHVPVELHFFQRNPFDTFRAALFQTVLIFTRRHFCMTHLYQYLLRGLLLFLFPSTLSAQVLHGTVTQGNSDKTIPGVAIRLIGSTQHAETNRKGAFVFTSDFTSKAVFLFEKEGFVSLERVVIFPKGKDSVCLNVKLTPINSSIGRNVQNVSSRLPRAYQKTPESVSALHATHFRELPARHLPEALLGLPGGALIQQSYASATPQIRGLSGRNVLLVEDGIPLMPVTLGAGPSPWWLTVDPSTVHRAEVLRGTGSVSHGNQATAGVIGLHSAPNRYTTSGWKLHGQATTRYQPGQAEMGGDASLHLSGRGVSVLTNAYRRNWGAMPLGAGSSAMPPPGYDSKGFQGKMGLRLGSQHQLEVGFQQHELRLDSAHAAALPPLPVELGLERQQAHTRWTGYFDQPWWQEVRVTAVAQRFGLDRYKNGHQADAAESEREEVQTLRAMVEVHAQPNFLWHIASGVDLARHEVSSEAWRLPLDGAPEASAPTIPTGATQEEIGIYSLHTVDLLKLHLSFGGRAHAQRVSWTDPTWGEDSWSPQALTGNVSAMFELSRHVEIVSSFRTGFRAPGLTDLRTSQGASGYLLRPSDSLGTERIFSSEIGLKAESRWFTGSLSFYHQQLGDWIREVSTNTLYQGAIIHQAQNIDQGFVQGVEAEMEVPLRSFASLYGSLTYTQGMSLKQGDFLPYVPPLSSRFGLRLSPVAGFWSRLEWRHASRQEQISAIDLLNPQQNPDGTPGWNVFHLHVGYDFAWGYAMIGVENMLNTRFAYHGSAIESPGRLILFSLQLGF